jgi:CheY-like chemotaxis protein
MTKSRTILFVEDNAVILTAYRKPLELTGFTVVPAYDGIEAMRYLNQSKPDLILLDLMLPKIDGEVVLKLIYDNPNLRHIPVILLSTNSVVSVANEKVLEKAERHLLKSTCTFPILHEAIEQVLAEAGAAKDHSPRACPTAVPNILRLLQWNLKGIDPAAKTQMDQ